MRQNHLLPLAEVRKREELAKQNAEQEKLDKENAERKISLYKAMGYSVASGLVGYMLAYSLHTSAVLPQERLLSKVITPTFIFACAVLGGYFSIDNNDAKVNVNQGRGS